VALAVDQHEFLAVFTGYNLDLWPAPAALSLVAFTAVCLALFPGPSRDRLACALLAALWAWAGLVYGGLHLSRLTPLLGYGIAVVFVAQAALFVHHGVVRHDVRFWMHGGSRHLAGILLVFYALVAYPSMSALLGHAFPSAPSFGVPTPVTIFTLGMLLLTRAPYARALFALPLFWCVVGTWLAVELRVREDLGLLIAAALVVTMTPHDEDPDGIEAAH
jgi:hypothetical protein